jgi:hypothetical protein
MIKTPFQQKWDKMKISHGVLCTIGVLFAVLAGILIRLIPGRYSVRAHYCSQVLALSLLFAGLGTGIWLALQNHSVSYEPAHHSLCYYGMMQKLLYLH